MILKSWNGKNGWLYQGRKKMGWIKEAVVVKEEATQKSEVPKIVVEDPAIYLQKLLAGETKVAQTFRLGVRVFNGIDNNFNRNGSNCGFNALRIRREEVLDWLLKQNNIDRPEARAMLIPELIAAVSAGQLPRGMEGRK